MGEESRRSLQARAVWVKILCENRSPVARRKSPKKFRADIEARRRARESGAKPAATRVIENKRRKPAKHTKKWLESELD